MSTDPRILELEREVRGTARLTTALLVLFILLVVGCCLYAWYRVRQALSPEALAEDVRSYVEANAPKWQQELKTRIVKAAPKLARKMDRRTVATMPQARSTLETYLEQQMTADLARGEAITEEEFRKFLQDNRDTIKKTFTQLRQAPKETDHLAGELEKAVDRRLGVNLRRQSGLLLQGFRQVNAKLQRLSEKSAALTPTEQVEQRIVRILRALQIEGSRKVKKG